MGQKWQKLQIQELLNEVHPKGLIFKMTLFSLIDIDKIMPKNPKLWKQVKTENCAKPLTCQNEQFSRGQFFGKFIIFGAFGEKALDIMKDDYFEKNFWEKKPL